MTEQTLKAADNVIGTTKEKWTMEERKAKTIERVKAAAKMGIKVSYIISRANLSKFRINCIVSDKPEAYDFTNTRERGLTDEEDSALNAVLDDIKKSL